MILPPPAGKFQPIRFTLPITAIAIPENMGIYRIVCNPMRRVYVGQAQSLPRRWLEHQTNLLMRLHTNNKLQAAFNKYGPNAFYFQVLEVMHGPYKFDGLTPAEQRWLDAHPRVFNGRPAGSDEWLARYPAARPRDRNS